jgi:uncharacterized protein YndB with AHSA1/START domain
MNIFQIIGALLAGVITIAYAPFAVNSQMETAKPMSNPTNGSKDVVVTRTFDAPVDEIWKYWTDSEKVKKWWGPKGFTAPIARMDFREGGTSLVCMRAPKEFGGQDMYNTWTYSKIVPMERIEFILNFADKEGNKLDPAKLGLPPGIPQDVPHVVTLKAVGDKKTEITVAEHGYTLDQAVELSKTGLIECLDKMAASLSE